MSMIIMVNVNGVIYPVTLVAFIAMYWRYLALSIQALLIHHAAMLGAWE